MVDHQNILECYMMKTFTCGEITLTNDIQDEFKDKYLIMHKYEDGTIKVRTKEYNERCIDKW